ncbi:hypothetical protein [Salinibaculum rarum]|uniref:hypothetical protein n=1 Tax=Salinibaculum rarum TaxID=3058903 RepID=UPI00265D727B|nr:hypothetical protein [Salinibaculum sp. KK48]
MTIPELPADYKNVKHARLKDAAPFIKDAVFFNHPEEGWVRVLDVIADIDTDIVVAAYADAATGEFRGLYKSWYSNSEELIVETTAEFVPEHIHDAPDEVEPADDLVADLTNTSLEE